MKIIKRKEWAERIGFEVPQSDERFVRTEIKGQQFVVETSNAQCCYQIMHFNNVVERVEFLRRNNLVARHVDSEIWIVFSGLVNDVEYENLETYTNYLKTTFDAAADWLRKEVTNAKC